MPLCLSKQLTLVVNNTFDQLFPGHISVSCCKLRFLQHGNAYFALHVIGFARERVNMTFSIAPAAQYCSIAPERVN